MSKSRYVSSNSKIQFSLFLDLLDHQGNKRDNPEETSSRLLCGRSLSAVLAWKGTYSALFDTVHEASPLLTMVLPILLFHGQLTLSICLDGLPATSVLQPSAHTPPTWWFCIDGPDGGFVLVAFCTDQHKDGSATALIMVLYWWPSWWSCIGGILYSVLLALRMALGSAMALKMVLYWPWRWFRVLALVVELCSASALWVSLFLGLFSCYNVRLSVF